LAQLAPNVIGIPKSNGSIFKVNAAEVTIGERIMIMEILLMSLLENTVKAVTIIMIANRLSPDIVL
jgi:hypothetical protein